MSMKSILPGIVAGSLLAGVAAVAFSRAQPDPLIPDLAPLVASRQQVSVAPTTAAASGKIAGAKIRPGTVSAEDEARIARVTATLLERSHYARQPLDDSVSARLFEQFLDTLDPQRVFFLESDVAEFAPLRSTLDDQVKAGDTSAARTIFSRLLERYEQNNAFAQETLKDASAFNFTGSDTVLIDREKAERPATLDEAKALWKQRIRSEYLTEKLNKKPAAEITETLTRRYQRNLRDLKELDGDDLFELFLNTLAHAYDPHTDYFGKATAENFSIGMKLSLFGIGARLKEEDGYTVIEDLTPGGPAEKSGKLHPGDKIAAVAQGNDGKPVDVVDMKVTKVVEYIRGPKGSVVKLIVIPVNAADNSQRVAITLVRDEVKLEEQAAKARLIEQPGANGTTTRLGVIDLPLFYQDPEKGKSATADVAALLEKLKKEKVDGVILDLRRNGGGSLPEAIGITGLFIPKGPVVQVRNWDGDVEVNRDTNGAVTYDGPLVVLVSRLSASASEIVAGALQDYNRALIVGDSPSFGKGTVQALLNLDQIMERAQLKTESNPGQLKLTIQKFYRATGSSTQLKGVAPDITLPSPTSVLKIGEGELENPLPWDTVPTAKFDKQNRTQPYLAELKRLAAGRVASDRDFAYQRQQIERVRKLEARKLVSLNEAERLKERQELEARQKAREKELEARPAPKGKVYSITLRDAAKPGLPAPLTAAQLKNGEKAEKAPDADEGSAGEDGAARRRIPEPDILLEESQRILRDYVALTKKGGAAGSGSLAAGRGR
ncbi:MAG TPA: carboxy terminal-processing peptidase [Armatimonadaceae bacterium]|nr:carboxy terminal-processing peptidase [Armatimonadaceae bacterium]